MLQTIRQWSGNSSHFIFQGRVKSYISCDNLLLTNICTCAAIVWFRTHHVKCLLTTLPLQEEETSRQLNTRFVHVILDQLPVHVSVVCLFHSSHLMIHSRTGSFLNHCFCSKLLDVTSICRAKMEDSCPSQSFPSNTGKIIKPSINSVVLHFTTKTEAKLKF